MFRSVRYTFGIRFLFVVVLLCALASGAWMLWIHPQQKQIALIDRIASAGAVVETIDNDNWLLRTLAGENYGKTPSRISFPHRPLHQLVAGAVIIRPPEFTDGAGFVRYQVPIEDLSLLKHCTALEALELSMVDLDDRGLKFLEPLAHLTTLDLSFTHITDNGLESLSPLTALTALNLEGTRISGKAGDIIRNMVRLESINLSRTAVNDVAWIVHCPELRALTLDHLPLGDDDMSAIANMPALATLSIRHTNVTDQGIASLARTQSLEHLDGVGTRITKDGVNQLKKSLPGLKTDLDRHWQSLDYLDVLDNYLRTTKSEN